MDHPSYHIVYPPEYDVEDWIYESKGYVVVRVVVDRPSATFTLTIRDPTRLMQDVKAELGSSAYFFENNIVVVACVDRPSIEAAIGGLARARFEGLTRGGGIG